MTLNLSVAFSASMADQLQQVIQRVMQVVSPQRIVLFGSSVRGDMTRDSDLDVLVVVRGPVHRRQTAQAIYRHLHGIEIPVDVVVATEDDLVQYSQQPGVLRHALQEGRVIYEAG